MRRPGHDDEVAQQREAALTEQIPRIRRYLSRMLRRNEIDDALQTVLARVLERSENFRGEGSYGAWVLGVARNVGLEMARTRQKQPKTVDADALKSSDLLNEAPVASQEDILGDRQEHALAMSALDTLSLEEKLVLLMTYADGLNGPDAAQLLDISPAAFRQRLSRARQSLAKALADKKKDGSPASLEELQRWERLLRPSTEE